MTEEPTGAAVEEMPSEPRLARVCVNVPGAIAWKNAPPVSVSEIRPIRVAPGGPKIVGSPESSSVPTSAGSGKLLPPSEDRNR